MSDLKPDDRTLAALVHLDMDSSFHLVTDWLASVRSVELETCAVAGAEVAVRQHQGRAALLKEIVDLFRGARERLEKRRRMAD